jgi:hypothetical protein
MRFLDVFANADILAAEISLKLASSDTVINECRNYLRHLKGFRSDMRGLDCLSDDAMYVRSALSRELISQARRAVRAVIEITVRETNRTEKLLGFFTAIDVHEAAAVLNTCKYLGSGNWEANASGTRFANGFDTGQMSVEKAVSTASRLRREAYVIINRNGYEASAFPCANERQLEHVV